MTATAERSSAQEEAGRYATLLEWGTRAGLAVMLLAFCAYVFGWADPLVPLDRLPHLWRLPLKDYMAQSGMPSGWAWVGLAGKGDLANLLGIGLLASCSLPPLLGSMLLFLRRRDFVYAALSLSVALVVVLAASGILSGGH